MRIGDEHVQFTKLLAIALCAFYVTQTAATFIMICVMMEVADPLLMLMKDTLWLYGLIYGCYAGNSAVEKTFTLKRQADQLINDDSKSAG